MAGLENITNKNEPALFTDCELLKSTKALVKEERHLLSKILKSLKEVERRKLFSDLGYRSLFEYAVKELGYSEGQAGRRIQAMRLINEIPEVEEKIENGSLSLSNISQAQSFFREMRKMNSQRQMKLDDESNLKEIDLFSASNKISVLEKLENKSTREAEKILLELNPKAINLKEKERTLSNELTEVRFVMTDELKEKLEELRSFLGPRGAFLGFSELISELTDVAIEALRKKKFGSRNSKRLNSNPQKSDNLHQTPAPELQRVSTNAVNQNRRSRYIPRLLKTQIWLRDNGECQICKSKRNLNFDHTYPYAMGGESKEENLRLLCHHCNQRQAFKKFGLTKMENFKLK